MNAREQIVSERRKACLADIVRSRALLTKGPGEEPFVLASGETSRYYLDCRRATLDPDALNEIIFCMWQMLPHATMHHTGIDAVGGPCIGADPIVGGLVYHGSMSHGKRPSGFLVRKEDKAHGTGGRIVGLLQPHFKVALVEDVVTTGESLLSAVKAVQEIGCEVLGVYPLVDRLQGARQLFAQHRIYFEPVLTINDLGIPDENEEDTEIEE